MVKWPFSRKQTSDTGVPPEVQEYYEAERRERTGMAWLLAAATLVATILLVLGLFYGGRWAYRTLFDNDEKQTESQVEQEIGSFGEDQSDGTTGSDDGNAPETDSEPAELPGDDTEDSNESSTSTQDETETPVRTPRTGPSDLPSTGPSSNL